MAVFTPVDRAALDAFLADYDLAPLTDFEGIAEGVENTNYCITTADRPYILTLYERRVRADDLPFFLDLMGYLADQGVPTARPIARKDGGVLGTLSGRPAAVIEFLTGKAVDVPTTDHAASAGAALARLHDAGQGFAEARTNDLGPPAWLDLLDRNRTGAGTVTPDLAPALAKQIDATLAVWPEGLPRGIVHADLFPDNVLFDGTDVTGLIDFYFACTDFLAYDIAITINAWAFDADGHFNPISRRQFLRAMKVSGRLRARNARPCPPSRAGQHCGSF
jgi:homoserine kinase type II